MKKFITISFFIFVLSLLLNLEAKSQLPVPHPKNPDIKWEPGPKSLTFANDKGVLYLSNKFVFAPPEEAEKYLKAQLVKPPNELAGLVMSSNIDDMWFVLLEYKEIGFVEEKYLNEISAEGFMQGVQMATDIEKAKTKFMYSPVAAPELNGYEQEPLYDPQNNSLQTALKVKQGKVDLINYLTMYFGRNGVINARLVCKADEFPAIKNEVDKLLGEIKFTRNNQYADYNSNTDKLAFSRGSDLMNFLTGAQPDKKKMQEDKIATGINNPLAKSNNAKNTAPAAASTSFPTDGQVPGAGDIVKGFATNFIMIGLIGLLIIGAVVYHLMKS
jgi:uncharacterized membrane-anchored protein